MLKSLGLLGLSVLLLVGGSCSKNYTIIKAYPRTGAEAHLSNQPEVETERLMAKSIEAYSRGKMDSSKGGFLSVLKVDKTNWEALYYLGLIARDKGDCRTAVRRCQAALEFLPREGEGRSKLYYVMGESYELMGELPRAQQCFITALKLNPGLSAASQGLERIEHQRRHKD